MVTERIERYWIVTTNGAEQISIRPGSSVEIGRRPLRPLPDDGFTRWEVADDTRSMSKRHAIISVQDQGSASVRDLNSTNGSYIVGGNGVLKRLEPGVDFQLSGSPVRMQFGDVPVDFIRVDKPAEPAAPKVSNLFDYAVADAKQEPDAADMSVDDILNLRAGEPTTAFHRDSVARRVHAVDVAASTSYPPHAEPGEGTAKDRSGLSDQDGHDDERDSESSVSSPATFAGTAAATPASASGDANAVVSDDVIGNGAVEDEAAANDTDNATGNGAEMDVRDADGAGRDTDGTVSAGSSTHPVEHLSLNVVQSSSAIVEERDLFVDALSETGQDGASGASNGADSSVKDGSAEKERSQGGDTHGDHEPVLTDHETHHAQSISVQEVFGARTVQADGEASDSDVHGMSAKGQVAQSDASADQSPDATAVFTPVFEPGSVFDKVARGTFSKREPAVQVDGLNSDQAKITTDFTEQFEIARHPQLLPFLAMNPSLYDDLYAWLAAQGNKDIDAALAKNAGYDEYRKAVGK